MNELTGTRRRSIVDVVEIYEAMDGWRWRAKAGNGEIVASGEAYDSKQNVERAVTAIWPDVRVLHLGPSPV